MKFVVILLTVFLVWCMSIVESRRYKLHDHIALVANTVGPFNNPTETYPVSLMSFFFIKLISLIQSCLIHPMKIFF